MYPSPPFHRSAQHAIDEDTTLFFDLDGTLVDSDYANFLAYKQAIEAVTGMSTDIAFNRQQRFNRTILAECFPCLSQEQLNEIILLKESYTKDHLKHTALIAPTVMILKQYARTHRTVLVSHCREDRALETLAFYGLTDDFDDLLFRHSDNSKSVNKYQRAIEWTGVSPRSVVAYENENTEIANAMAAGINTINPGVNLALWKALLLKQTSV